MTKRERISKAINFQEVDLIPTIGGWLNSAEHYQALSGIKPEELWADPEKAAIRAYQRLDVDGLIAFHPPVGRDEYRKGLAETEEKRQKYRSPEDVLAYINSLPSADSLETSFDSNAFYEKYVEDRLTMQRKLGEMVWMPGGYGCVFEWFEEFGYENYLAAISLYPDTVRKLFEYSAEEGRLKNIQIAKATKQNNFVPISVVGADICSSRGPMVSPEVLKEIYFPNWKIALAPLHEAGVRTVWHCDGNVLPILEQILEIGVSGLQGFQEELGVRIVDLAKRRTDSGKRLLFFGSISVSNLLVYGTVEDVKQQVKRSIDATGGRGIFIFSSNIIGPEVPVENIIAMYEHMSTDTVKR